ncbi:hypothetical protein R8Z50_15470 [Longispora sp. K20-0274]|uniref:hypothetical protein n=1 Tax=Longispora sp. K20-0274 TaxID=3088255 RepID=UPI00399B0386
MRRPLISLVPVLLILAGGTGCGPNTPVTAPTNAPTTAAASPSPAACPTDAEVLAAARVVNGGLPASASVRAGSLVCEAGWAVGSLDSEVGGATFVTHRVGGVWQGLTLGTGSMCDLPELPQMPAAVRARLHCA